MSNVDMAEDNMQDQMMRYGLVADPDEVDPVSGNEIPVGATAEGVRDDETVAISPGEFVIPDYAVRYHGVDFYMKSLEVAKDGLEQMDQMGMVGNPEEQTVSDNLPLPTMDMEGNMQTQQFQTGGLKTTALPQVPTLTPPTIPGQAVQSIPTTTTTAQQPIRPVSGQPIPVAPSSFAQLQPQAPTYRASQATAAGLPGGYDIEEFVNEQGNTIYLTTIGGAVQGGVPAGYRKRDATTTIPAISKPSSFEFPELGDTAKTTATALGALGAFNTINDLTDGKLVEGGIKLLESVPGGSELVDFVRQTGGSLKELIGGMVKSGAENFVNAAGGGTGLTGRALNVGLSKLAGAEALGAIGTGGGIAGGTGLTGQALNVGLSKLAGAEALGAIGAGGGIAGGTGLTGAGLNTGLATLEAANVGAGTTAAGAASGASGAAGAGTAAAGTTLASLAVPLGISAAILAIPTVSNLLNPRSKNRIQASRQAAGKVRELLISPDFNENNAARIRALTNLKGDTGKYGTVPSEGQVSSIGGALNPIDQRGGIDIIPTEAAKQLYTELVEEQKNRTLERKRSAITSDADDADRTRKLTAEQVEREFRSRMSGEGSGGE